MTFKNLITEQQYADDRGVSVRTIQRERSARIGPSFIKVGKKVFYRPKAIEEWLLSREQEQPRARMVS